MLTLGTEVRNTGTGAVGVVVGCGSSAALGWSGGSTVVEVEFALGRRESFRRVLGLGRVEVVR